MYAVIIALLALVLACAFAGSCRVEGFDEEPAPDVIEAGKLNAERLPPEEDEEEEERVKKDRMANRVPEDKIPTEEEGADMATEAPAVSEEESTMDAPPPGDEMPPPPPPEEGMSPPPASEGFAVEPFVGGMMARF